MLYNYVALVFFGVVALAVPGGLIIAAKLLGRKSRGNPVRNAPYESAEKTQGSARDAENEYLPFFALFLPFEIIVGMMIVWSISAYTLPYSVDVGIVVLGFVASIAAVFGYRRIVWDG